MRKIYVLIPLFAILAGCEDLSQNQLVGTTGGAAIGAIVTPHNPLQGALIGGAVGLVAGTYLGKDSAGSVSLPTSRRQPLHSKLPVTQ